MATLHEIDQTHIPSAQKISPATIVASRASQEPDAPRLDPGRPLLHGAARHIAGLFEPDGDQPRITASALLPAAWIQGHGHAQVFGWIGSFVLGIGFYSQPSRGRSVIRTPLTCFVLWTLGVAMRWVANIYGWHWRVLFVLSAGFELLVILLFLTAASHHKLAETAHGKQTKPRMELWMVSVLLSTAGLLASVAFNFVECLKLAMARNTARFSACTRSKIPCPSSLGISRPGRMGLLCALAAHVSRDFAGLVYGLFGAALILDLMGVLSGVSGWTKTASFLLAAGAVIIGLALHLAPATARTCKGPGNSPELSHSSFGLPMPGSRSQASWHLGRLSPMSTAASGAPLVTLLPSDSRHHGFRHRAAYSSSLCRHLLHLQQASHVPQPALAPDRLRLARLLRAAGLRRHPFLRVEDTSHLRNVGAWRRTGVRRQHRSAH